MSTRALCFVLLPFCPFVVIVAHCFVACNSGETADCEQLFIWPLSANPTGLIIFLHDLIADLILQCRLCAKKTLCKNQKGFNPLAEETKDDFEGCAHINGYHCNASMHCRSTSAVTSHNIQQIGHTVWRSLRPAPNLPCIN